MWTLLTKVEMMMIMIIIGNTVLGRVTVPQLPAVQPEVSKHPATEPYPESAESISRPHTIFEACFNVILSSTYPKWLHSFRSFWLKCCIQFLFLSCVLSVTVAFIFWLDCPSVSYICTLLCSSSVGFSVLVLDPLSLRFKHFRIQHPKCIYIPLASGTISDTPVNQITSRLTYVLRPLVSRHKNYGTYQIIKCRI